MTKQESGSVFSTPDAAEAAFYFAFGACDLDAMNDVWASEGVVCIHPGSDALLGRKSVMQSWVEILLHSELPSLHTEVLSRVVRGDLAVHVVEESIAPLGAQDMVSVVLATNVYCREENGWRLLEHHASSPRMLRRDLPMPASTRPTLQ
jgi:hypothetical protein